MSDHNFGPCSLCDCEFMRLFEVRNLSTGVLEQRVCCRRHPTRHWRPATEEDLQLARLARAEVTR